MNLFTYPNLINCMSSAGFKGPEKEWHRLLRARLHLLERDVSANSAVLRHGLRGGTISKESLYVAKLARLRVEYGP